MCALYFYILLFSPLGIYVVGCYEEREGGETFLKAVFGKSQEQGAEPAWGGCGWQGARDCAVFISFIKESSWNW